MKIIKQSFTKFMPLLFIPGMLMITFELNAQNNALELKGKYQLAGTASFNYYIDSNPFSGPRINSSIDHSYSYFLTNKFSIGYNTGVSYSRDVTNALGLQAGLYFKHYTIGKSFFECKPGLIYRTELIEQYGSTIGLHITGGIGYSFFLNEHLALEPIIQLSKNSTRTIFGDSHNITSFLIRDFIITMRFGISIYL